MSPRASPEERRFDLAVPATVDPTSFALSPDGRFLVFESSGDGPSRLWVQSFESARSWPLNGTEGGYAPFWSPDSKAIGFFAAGRLKRIDLDGGAIQILTISSLGFGGAWNREGMIVYTSNGVDRVLRISATGGEATSLKGVDCRQPHFLPDGHHFVCYESGRVLLSDLNGAPPRRLLDGDGSPFYRSGELLFVRQGTLFSQAFSESTMELSGSPKPIAARVNSVSISSSGDIAYRGNGANSLGQAIWIDRGGKELSKASAEFAPGYGWDLSPDERYLIISLAADVSGQEPAIWLLDLTRRVFTPVAPARSFFGFWSPDGRRVIYTRGSPGGAARDIYQWVRGTGREEHLFTINLEGVPRDWSSDGRFILFDTFDDRNQNSEMLALPVDANGKLTGQPLSVARPASSGQFSPDGRWVAYTSLKSGQPDIYLQPFPGPGAAVRVSANGGESVRWRGDGREIFYVAADGMLMSVPLRIRDSAPEPGVAAPLFRTHLWGSVEYAPRYDVSGDGQRFIMNVTQPVVAPISLILNGQRND